MEVDSNTSVFSDGKCPCLSITDLPEEILEYILSQLSPYQDLSAAKQVCKQWHRLVLGVTQMMQDNFRYSLRESKASWTQILPASTGPTERYSHCACYFDKSMYVFGGCTLSNTTFNDLWRFDLVSRQWIRPLAMGSYPSPKACASMIVYKKSLVLFGGWSHPTPFPLHQADRFFNELHMYSPLPNRWTQLTSVSATAPDPVAGHSVSIVQNTMVVFGGSHVPAAGSNDLWVFDFEYSSWKLQPVTGPKPNMRYGQSQTTIDDEHILILGGCGGPNQIFNDIWLLSLGGQEWTWVEVKINNPDFAATQLWCHPVCKVGNTLVILNKSPKSSETTAQSSQPPVQSIRVLSAQQQAENRFHMATSKPVPGSRNNVTSSTSASQENAPCSNNTVRENLSGPSLSMSQEIPPCSGNSERENVSGPSLSMSQEIPPCSGNSERENLSGPSLSVAQENPPCSGNSERENLSGPSLSMSQENPNDTSNSRIVVLPVPSMSQENQPYSSRNVLQENPFSPTSRPGLDPSVNMSQESPFSPPTSTSRPGLDPSVNMSQENPFSPPTSTSRPGLDPSVNMSQENPFSPPTRTSRPGLDPSVNMSQENPFSPPTRTSRPGLDPSVNMSQENPFSPPTSTSRPGLDPSVNMSQENPFSPPTSTGRPGLDPSVTTTLKNPLGVSNKSGDIPARTFRRYSTSSSDDADSTNVDMIVSFSSNVLSSDSLHAETTTSHGCAETTTSHGFAETTKSHGCAENTSQGCIKTTTSQGCVETISHVRKSERSHLQEEIFSRDQQKSSNLNTSCPDHRGGTLNLRPGHPSVKPNSMHDRQKQLDMLRRYEERIRHHANPAPVLNIRPNIHCASVSNSPRVPMCLFLLDIGSVTETQTSTWLCPRETFVCNSPDDRSITIFYSLVEGRSELVLFGGIQMDLSTTQRRMDISSKSHIVSNNLYVLRACKPRL